MSNVVGLLLSQESVLACNQSANLNDELILIHCFKRIQLDNESMLFNVEPIYLVDKLMFYRLFNVESIHLGDDLVLINAYSACTKDESKLNQHILMINQS